MEVFARFSPLIGGGAGVTTWFPIHVEIMLLLTTDNLYGKSSSKAKTSQKIMNTAILHRIDFVPQNPESTDTILQLLSLQDVPGKIRHRILAVGVEPHELDTCLTLISMDRLHSLLETKVSNMTTSIVVPLGKALFHQNFKGKMTDISSIQGIIGSVEEKNGSKLNLIRNNCYSFALNILSNLNVTYSMYPINQH
eukprot:CAMPEP_0176503468 /NCGR_PEP_ID=MMETSP0200_2-20121128/15378_1 /TAXON_ID=947934 /ORGANISM="Chaetoceros sp., Strain GSL56" /LENGTH=194 /DNA_ID=CAMNT_0017902759 /DNA_START=157 /DNA_END=741 /DNA_ORIENTATION=-